MRAQQSSWFQICFAVFAGVAGLCYLHGDTIMPPHLFIPGDMGDARFNNLVLEHVYRFMTGQTGELWTTAWNFYPQPKTFAYSDNLIGAQVFYLPWRLIGFDTMDAFQLWLVSCSVANYLCFLWFMRVMGFGLLESATGAFLFAFAMPRGAQLAHPQLLPACFTPLGLGCLVRYYQSVAARSRLIWFALFCVAFAWQLWAGVYLGWFFGLGLMFLMLAAFSHKTLRPHMLLRVKQDWKILCVGSVVLGAVLLPLAAVYLSIRGEVGGRSWDEVHRYIPGLGGIFLPIRESTFWSFLNPDSLKKLGGLRDWHEKQIFQGIIAFSSPIILWYLSRRYRKSSKTIAEPLPNLFFLAGVTLVALYFFSHYFGSGLSPWYLIYKMVPGANSIRAVGRIIMLILIPSAILCGLLLRTIRQNNRRGPLIASILGVFVVAENAYFSDYHFSKLDHRNNIASLSAKVAAARSESQCPVFYGVKNRGRFEYVTHVDAIWVAMQTGIPTLNGYSGNWPPDWPLYSVERRGPVDIDQWFEMKGSTLRAKDVCVISDW